jgi:hypothetical protein
MPSCCSSFNLNVAANFICIFLVYRQLVLFSNLSKFLHSFCGQKVSSSKLWGDYLLVCVCVCVCVQENFRDIWSSPNIMTVIISRTMTANVASTG